MTDLYCSMCEQKVDSLPYVLMDFIPEHRTPEGQPHTQDICQECKDAIGAMDYEDGTVSDEFHDNPFRVKKK